MDPRTEKIYRYTALVFAVIVLLIASEMSRDLAWQLQVDPAAWPRVTGELTGCDEKAYEGGKYPSLAVISLYVNGESPEDRYQYQNPKGFEEEVRDLCRVGGGVELTYFLARGNHTTHWIGSLTSRKQGVIFTAKDTLASLQDTGNLIAGFMVILSILLSAVWAFLIFLGKVRIPTQKNC
jgi:hypothetical protein